MNPKNEPLITVANAPNLKNHLKSLDNGEFPTVSNSTATSMAKMPILVESLTMDNSFPHIKTKKRVHPLIKITSFLSEIFTQIKELKLTHAVQFLY